MAMFQFSTIFRRILIHPFFAKFDQNSLVGLMHDSGLEYSEYERRFEYSDGQFRLK